MHIRQLSKARGDLESIVDYLREQSDELASRFVEAAASTFQFLAKNYEAGQLCGFTDPRAVTVRVWPIDHFRNFLVFSRFSDQEIEIVRVLHGARDIDAIFRIET